MTPKKSVKKDGLSGKQALGIGLGLTAAAAAAGGYLLYGSKDAAKNRKLVKDWTKKAKAEVVKGVKLASNLSQAEYEQLVETALKTYATAKDVSGTELQKFKKDMSTQWSKLQKVAQKKVVPKKVAKPTAKQTKKGK